MSVIERPRTVDIPAQEQRRTTHGTLVMIGGKAGDDLLHAISETLPPSSERHFMVAAMASGNPLSQYTRYKEGFSLSNVKTDHLLIQDEEQEEYKYLLDGISGVFFTGGQQDKLMAALNKSKLRKEIYDYYVSGGTILGTSAGASFMGEIMPIKDRHEKGIGFVPHIIDQHIRRSDREGRLHRLISEFPGRIGIGLDENTAAIYNTDGNLKILGEGQVFVLQTNESNEIDECVLTHGQQYSISEK
jgi:cyanophycinase